MIPKKNLCGVLVFGFLKFEFLKFLAAEMVATSAWFPLHRLSTIDS